jgi:hypothetical protein
MLASVVPHDQCYSVPGVAARATLSHVSFIFHVAMGYLDSIEDIIFYEIMRNGLTMEAKGFFLDRAIDIRLESYVLAHDMIHT